MENKFLTIVKEKPDEELLTMVYQIDQWDSEMLNAVEGELKNRQILPGDLNIRKEEIIEKELSDLERGKQASLLGQIIGWVAVFGFLGIIMGYNYAFSKSTSKYTGKEFYTYDKPSRENGTYLFYTSLVVLVLFILYKLISY